MVVKLSFSVIYFCVLLNSNIKIIQTISTMENTLQQVHVLFRHGDRTPDQYNLYPNDPHLNDTWYPYGLGALTKLGMKQMYELGKSLRKRYDIFLGDMYLPAIQEARSTDKSRTKLSLQLVLAGLWPPNKQQIFAQELPWQPIDYIYKPFEEDELLGFPLIRENCSIYRKEFLKIETSDEVQHFYKEKKEYINCIKIKSGLRLKSALELYSLYFGLYTEEHTNRTLSEWTKLVYPEFLENFVTNTYKWLTATNEMMRFAGGPLVKKVLLEAKDKIAGKTTTGEKKIFLYSGHEFNIAHVLRVLKSYKPHVPAYASHVIFELHKVDSKFGLKIYYQDTKQEEPKLLAIPGCDEFCPIDQFENMIKDVVPESFFKC